MDYNNDFRYDLKVAQETERWLGELLGGMGSTIEVKDETAQSWKTGNAFVEFESRGKPSGIATTQADYQTIVCSTSPGGPRTAIITPTVIYRAAAAKAYREHRVVSGGDSNTSLGVLMPIRWLIPKGC